MTKLELNLKFPDTIEYTALYITPDQFEADVELLKTHYLEPLPSTNQLTEILDYADKNNIKISYLFSRTKDEVQFTAFIGTVYFANGLFLDFNTKTFTTHLPKQC